MHAGMAGCGSERAGGDARAVYEPTRITGNGAVVVEEGKEREFLTGERGTLELARGDREIVFVRDGEVGVG
jgi:hypothetical protein